MTVALRLKMKPGWHTYWRNPGDSGLPTTLDWKLPPGVAAGPIQWPAPHALPAGPLVNYGYEGEVLHLVDLKAPPSVAPGGRETATAQRRLARLQGDLHSRGGRPRADAAGGRRAGPDPTWARADRRDARGAAAAARRLAGERRRARHRPSR